MNKIISNSIKFSFCKSYLISSAEAPELANAGLLYVGEAEQGPPYEMLRVGGAEKQHTTIWLIMEGTILFETGNKVFTAPPGSFVVQNSAFDRRCSMDHGVFHSFFFLLPGTTMSPGVHTAKYGNELQHLIRMLRRECMENRTFSAGRSLIISLLDFYLKRELALEPSFSGIDKAVALIEHNLSEQWTTAKIARKLNISTAQFYQKCVQQCGCSPSELITKIKFRHAQYLLQNSNMNLDEIAEHLGYQTAYSFSKAFYKHMGIRPGTARNSFRFSDSTLACPSNDINSQKK